MKKILVVVIAAVVLIAGLVGVKFWLTAKYENDLKAYLAKNEDKYAVQYDDFSLCLLNGTATLSQVRITDKATQEMHVIHEVHVGNFDADHEVPHSMDLSIQGLEIRFEDLDDKGTSLVELGYKSPLLVNFGMAYEWDESDKVIDVTELSFSGDEMGELKADFRFGNVNLNVEKPEMAAFAMTFDSFGLRYEDQGLFAKAIAKDAEAMRKAIAEVDTAITTSTDPLATEALKALRDFLKNPKEIFITAKPEQPVPLMGLIMGFSDPAALIKMLNLKIEG